MKHNPIHIYGTHAVTAALTHAPECVERLLLARGGPSTLRALAQKAGVPIEPLQEKTLPKDIEQDAAHQGAVASINAKGIAKQGKQYLEELEVNENTCLVVLDEVQDPHNVGAVIRSALALGATAVLMPEHRQSPVTGTVVKASAGAAFMLPIVTVGNVNTTLRQLKDRGFWIYGLDMNGESLQNEAFDAPTVLVLGNEGSGMREKTLETCDLTLSIPMEKSAESLNISVAAGIALYAWQSRRS